MKTLVLYHSNCLDGFTAAWAAWCKYGDSAEYVPVQYGPGQKVPEVAGRDVHSKARSLLVLDHHKTAAADLEGLPFCTFDMNRSGAGIAWDELHAERRPPLINYVEDRDLWRFALPCSKEINAFIGTHDQNFKAWTELSDTVRTSFGHAISAGGAVLRSTARYVEQMAKEARIVEFAGHRVPVVNAPYIHVSELAGHLAEGQPFAAAWYQQADDTYKYCLRSKDNGVDVSEIAKRYGGGGHRGAAGFVVDQRIDG
jgi:hypothetical protein